MVGRLCTAVFGTLLLRIVGYVSSHLQALQGLQQKRFSPAALIGCEAKINYLTIQTLLGFFPLRPGRFLEAS
jgi:hypothetical protein